MKRYTHQTEKWAASHAAVDPRKSTGRWPAVTHTVGPVEGSAAHPAKGCAVGLVKGCTVGLVKGCTVGLVKGCTVGLVKGCTVGLVKGCTVGLVKGCTVGLEEGPAVGHVVFSLVAVQSKLSYDQPITDLMIHVPVGISQRQVIATTGFS